MNVCHEKSPFHSGLHGYDFCIVVIARKLLGDVVMHSILQKIHRFATYIMYNVQPTQTEVNLGKT